MKPAPVPTLFAQILGLVVISLVATVLVGVGAILLAPQTDERFSYGEVLEAAQTKAPVQSSTNNRWLAANYQDEPPPQPDGPVGGVRFFIARQLDISPDDVVYWTQQRSPILNRLWSRIEGGGRNPPAPPPQNAGPGIPGAPTQQATGDGRNGAPAGNGQPQQGATGQPGQNAQPGAQPPPGGGRGGFFNGMQLANSLEPYLTIEGRNELERWKARAREIQQQGDQESLNNRVAQVFELGVRQPDGRWLVIEPQRTLNLYSWQITSLGVLLISILLVSPLAWLLARRVSQPLVAFAAAAERLGRDPRSPPLQATGSSEVRMAVNAFNEMQVRLRRYVEDRTSMVAAIAHDLRTPLTRVRFRVDALPDDIRPKLEADIDQMDEMISSALAFARDAALPAERSKLDLTSLIQTIFDDAEETGAKVKFDDAKEKLVVLGDSLSLKRMLTNLVDNAVKYGKEAHGRIYRKDDQAVIEIDDKGPGIPPNELERVFEPFYRREPSRNRDTGGTGLGLAVVRSIALAHGGMVTLENKQGGGLRARVTLPL